MKREVSLSGITLLYIVMRRPLRRISLRMILPDRCLECPGTGLAWLVGLRNIWSTPALAHRDVRTVSQRSSWAYGGNVCAVRRAIEARRPRSYGESSPLMRPFPGKRRESPLTAGGGARNISPCAADGRKRRGGAAKDAPGTLKTGYRGKRIGTRAGPPPAWCRRRSPTRDQFQEEPDPGFRPSFRWLFLYFIFELRRPSGRPNEEFDPGSG